MSSFEKWWKEVEDLPHPDGNIFTVVPVIARMVWNASRQQLIQELREWVFKNYFSTAVLANFVVDKDAILQKLSDMEEE
jgi:hypothetical protein